MGVPSDDCSLQAQRNVHTTISLHSKVCSVFFANYQFGSHWIGTSNTLPAYGTRPACPPAPAAASRASKFFQLCCVTPIDYGVRDGHDMIHLETTPIFSSF